MKHLYYIRHGQSQANVDSTWGGDTQLTQQGIKEAEAEGKRAKAEQFMPDSILVSPLTRTIKTAEIVADAIGYSRDKIIVDARLKERRMGDIEGTPMKDIVPGSPNYRTLDLIPTVETIEELQARVAAFLETVKQRPEDTILLVGHAAFGRCLRRIVAGKPYTDEYNAEFKQIPNAKIFKLI